MGGRERGRGRALAAALALTLAWPTAALAQDAIDVDSSFTTFTPVITPEQAIQTTFVPPVSAAGVPRVEVRCDNPTRREFPNLAQVRRTGHAGLGAIGATYTSNASESDGGEDDILTTTTLRLERSRRSEHGLCRVVTDPTTGNRATVFDAQMSYSIYAQSLNLAFRDDNGVDASRLTIGGNISWRLDDGRTLGYERYRTRAFAQLENSVTYGGVYDDWISTTHDARIGVTHTLRLYNADAAVPGSTNGALTLQAAVGRVFANPERASYNLATATLAREWQFNPDWAIKATGAVTYQNYSDAVPQDFDDTRYRLALTITRTFATDVAAEVTFNVDARTSDVPAREFEAASLPLVFKITRRF
ncbi:MAG: hypothetical protein ACT4OF_14570 [Caulobacteraceae bacterium]